MNISRYSAVTINFLLICSIISFGARPLDVVQDSGPVSEVIMESMDLDLEEWSLVRNKMLRFHFNISEDIKAVVQSIRAEMRPELIPLAEEKANFGKLVKTAVREMWSLEYEVDGLQSQFAESIGTLDLDNIDVDFIEDMMLKSKPLQGILNDIRGRQIKKLEEVKKTYGEAIKELEAMIVERPPKGLEEDIPAEKPAEAAAAEGEAAPAAEAAAPPAPEEAPAPAE